MTRKMLILLAALAAAVALLVPAPVMSASDTPCVGALTGTFDNVVVPAGAICTLTNSTVHGNVTALENSQLNYFRNQIGGNVIGDNAERVDSLDPGLNVIQGNVHVWGGDVDDAARDFDLINDTVHGDVWVEKLQAGDIDIENTSVPNGNIQVNQNNVTGTFVGLEITGSNVPNGDVQVAENAITFHLFVLSNRVGSDMQVLKNTGLGAKNVQNNTVRENLQCFDNAPPFVGGPNVSGKAEGQCF